MNVTRLQVVARGLTHRCPNCGARTLFAPGKLFQVNKSCSACGFRFERDNDEGFFLGSMSLNYGVTLVGFLTPLMLLADSRLTALWQQLGLGVLTFGLLWLCTQRLDREARRQVWLCVVVATGFEIRAQIIWAKQHFALSRGH